MKFERDTEVKEALKIGRYANAFKVKELILNFSVQVYDRDYALVRRNSHHIMRGTELIYLLRFLEKRGLNREFHDILMNKIPHFIQGSLDNHGNPIRFDERTGLEPEIKSVILYPEDKFDENGRFFDPRTIVDLFGKDVLYMNKLYRIKEG